MGKIRCDLVGSRCRLFGGAVFLAMNWEIVIISLDLVATLAYGTINRPGKMRLLERQWKVSPG